MSLGVVGPAVIVVGWQPITVALGLLNLAHATLVVVATVRYAIARNLR